MKRRDFLLSSAAVAIVAGAPFGASALQRGSLLDDPHAWIGTEFALPDGTRLVLSSVSERRFDAHTVQSNLQFTSHAGTPLREGSYELCSEALNETLFLQAGRAGPVACVNRLHHALA
jgi:hypothetical protein